MNFLGFKIFIYIFIIVTITILVSLEYKGRINSLDDQIEKEKAKKKHYGDSDNYINNSKRFMSDYKITLLEDKRHHYYMMCAQGIMVLSILFLFIFLGYWWPNKLLDFNSQINIITVVSSIVGVVAIAQIFETFISDGLKWVDSVSQEHPIISFLFIICSPIMIPFFILYFILIKPFITFGKKCWHKIKKRPIQQKAEWFS